MTTGSAAAVRELRPNIAEQALGTAGVLAGWGTHGCPFGRKMAFMSLGAGRP